MEDNLFGVIFKWWFKGWWKKLLVYKKWNKFICIGFFLKEVILCFEYISRNCCCLNCSYFYVCSFYLNGVCKCGKSCKKGYNFDDDYN